MTHLLATTTYKWKDSSFLFIICWEERWVSGQAVDFLKVIRSTEIQHKLMEYIVWVKKKLIWQNYLTVLQFCKTE